MRTPKSPGRAGGRLALVAVAVVAGCRPAPEIPTPPGKANAGPTQVTLVRPETKSIRRVVEQPGMIHAFEATNLYSRVPGYVVKVNCDIGQKVVGGQILAEISVRELEQELMQKQAVSRQKEAEVEQARRALAAAEAHVTTAEATVVEANAYADRWASEAKRVEKLVASGTIDVQTHEETRNQARAAAARVTSAEAAVLKARADRDKAVADVSAAAARVDVAKADASQSATMLDYAKIRAPYDGVVTSRKVNTGDFVQPAGGKGDWLFAVARLDPVRVVVAVPEADAGLVRERAPVQLVIAAARPAPFDATVTRMSWALDPAARTLRAEIDLPNADGALRPGMYAYARIANQYPAALTLPTPALVKQGEHTVCFMSDAGRAVAVRVQVGRSDGQRTEVIKWQKAGSTGDWQDFAGSEPVIARAAGLADGQAIEIAPAAK